MDAFWKTAVWQQYGAAIDMLENAITACPDHLWGDRSRNPEYWYLVSHTLFFLDFYLTDAPEGEFRPPAPFGLEELDPAGVMPPRVYTKDELLTYLRYDRDKCRANIAAMTDADARAVALSRPSLSRGECLLYNMRHVQHHAAQLNLILRQTIDSAPRWVSIARQKLADGPSSKV